MLLSRLRRISKNQNQIITNDMSFVSIAEAIDVFFFAIDFLCADVKDPNVLPSTCLQLSCRSGVLVPEL
jgi:hypothetical protein